MLDFCDIFKMNNQPVIIAEIKFSSPSLGVIYKGNHDPSAIAQSYLLNGAAALSVLTEPNYFKGNIEYIKEIRGAFPKVHILMKDFISTKTQLDRGLEYGANAVLLIVGFLAPKLLRELYDYAVGLGLTPVVEVHNLGELELALKLDPKIIGINNRSLDTLEIDLNISRELVRVVPNNIDVICESGLETKAQIQEMQGLGFDGFLIGTRLMSHENPGEALSQLLGEC